MQSFRWVRVRVYHRLTNSMYFAQKICIQEPLRKSFLPRLNRCRRGREKSSRIFFRLIWQRREKAMRTRHLIKDVQLFIYVINIMFKAHSPYPHIWVEEKCKWRQNSLLLRISMMDMSRFIMKNTSKTCEYMNRRCEQGRSFFDGSFISRPLHPFSYVWMCSISQKRNL